MNTMLEPLRAGYAAPALAGGRGLAQRDEVIWWVVVVGVAYGVALAWATWCRSTGGSAEISFGWSGFKVVCRGK